MFLITRPKHDITTHYLSIWSGDIVNVAKKKGKKVIDLQDKKADKKNLESYLSKKPVKFVMFNGHGDDNLITGHNNKILVESPKNEKILKSKIIYCRSCRSGKKLGPDSVISGAKAFIGYDDDFIFFYEDQKVSNPLKDKTAARFIEPTNTLVISLLKGNSVEESYKRSMKKFKQNITDLLTSDASDADRNSVRFLLWDMDHQIYHGNGKSRY